MGKIYYLFSILFFGVLFLNNSSNPPNGYTGAPGDGLCSNCHTQGSSGNLSGSVDIIGLPSTITPNTDYSITLRINNTTSPLTDADRGGFQLVVLDQNNTKVGTLKTPGSSSTITPSGGRDYWEHNPAVLFNGNSSITYTVVWRSPGATGQTVTMYAASIMADKNGNTNDNDLLLTSQASGTLPQAPNVTATITQMKNPTCYGFTNGTMTVTASNGTPPYTYAWSNGQTTAMATNLGAGVHTVTVSDANLTMMVVSGTLTEPKIIEITGNGKFLTTCPKGSDGNITVSVTGGTAPYTYKWFNGNTTKTISNLRAGDYVVTITDMAMCTQTQSFTITEPFDFVIFSNILKSPACILDNTGSIKLEATGATAPYTYLWSSGETTVQINNKKVANYTCTITDNLGCKINNTTKLLVKDSIYPTIDTTPLTLYLSTTGKTVLTPSKIKLRVFDNCDTGLVINTSQDSFTCSHLGTQLINTQVTDLFGNKTTGQLKVNIVDTIAPIIITWPDSFSYRCNIIVPQVIATDNCGFAELKQIAGPTKDEYFPNGKSESVFNAKDLSNNSSTKSYTVIIENPLSLSNDSIQFDYCTGRNANFNLILKSKLRDTFSLFLNNIWQGVYDTTTLLHFDNFQPSDSILFIQDAFRCKAEQIIRFEYPDSAISLLKANITNATSCNANDGKIELEFKGNLVTGNWYDAAKNKLSNQTNNQFKVGDYFFIASDKPEGDTTACTFEFGPFSVNCIVSNNNNIQSNIQVYPNPIRELLRIKSDHKLFGYEIFNISGLSLLKDNFLNNEYLISTEMFPNGVYLLKINTLNGFNMKRILIYK